MPATGRRRAPVRVTHDMDAILQRQAVFHLTGRLPPPAIEAAERVDVRPALLARFRELDKLRYDFPLVLVDGPDGEFVRSLSAIVNGLVRDIVPAGPDGEALRRQLLRVEHEIRRRVGSGTRGTLAVLWDEVVSDLGRAPDAAPLTALLTQVGGALNLDGELVDCDRELPARLLTHAWRAVQDRKARQARKEISALIVRLTDLLRADFLRSPDGRRPESLAAAVGSAHQRLFDFEAMSKMLGHAPATQRLTGTRRRRVERALEVLRAQRFFAALVGEPSVQASPIPYGFEFQDAAEAIAAYRQRQPAMAELVKAMSLATLEADGRYVEVVHDAFFEAFGEHALGDRELAMFPDYLVCLGTGHGGSGYGALLELLSSGLPVKVVAQVDDILDDENVGEHHFAFGVRSTQVASAAVGLSDCFVLQSTSSNLYQLRRALERGMSFAGPALFSVFSGAGGGEDRLPPYLIAAAAMQSRAFPAFSYDPGAGPGLADRFSLENNPAPETDWPVARFEYADADLQRVATPTAFTFPDFVVADARHASHFVRAPHEQWNEGMVPIADWLAQSAAATDDRVPYVLAVDPDDVLQRLIVDDQVVRAARRCRETWHRLQELGGVHSSHAERRLEREKSVWEAHKKAELDALRATASVAGRADVAPEAAVAASPAPPTAATDVTAESAAPSRSKDEAYIETIRCSTCNECTQINDRMFAYNDDKQAYIKDVTAGTYRQLVEAAESCQLSIIHPGKPRDAGEPGLAELIERAQPFL